MFKPLLQTHFAFKPLALALGVAIVHLPALAAEPQVADESRVLPRMVVSAAGFEQKLVDAPASVTVVSREELESKPYTSLADALRDVEGIDVGAGIDKNG
ncbi:MAG TPA: TonB-dependent receptor plug domain-containing protein, partial [Psychromonas sp.]